jgi:hypothetical protein
MKTKARESAKADVKAAADAPKRLRRMKNRT